MHPIPMMQPLQPIPSSSPDAANAHPMTVNGCIGHRSLLRVQPSTFGSVIGVGRRLPICSLSRHHSIVANAKKTVIQPRYSIGMLHFTYDSKIAVQPKNR
jgi:hypothetical protein